jgi:hypothetical protein
MMAKLQASDARLLCEHSTALRFLCLVLTKASFKMLETLWYTLKPLLCLMITMGIALSTFLFAFYLCLKIRVDIALDISLKYFSLAL